MATFSLDTLRELLRHMEWADATVWGALLSHSAAEQDARLRQLLLHMHGVQRAFLQMWTTGPGAFPALEESVEFDAIRRWAQSYYLELTAALGTFDETILTRPVRMPGLEPYEQQLGRRFDTPSLGETMLQVATHSTHHRGQVNARLRELGGEPPLVDYIAWIWFGKPAPEWGAAGRVR